MNLVVEVVVMEAVDVVRVVQVGLFVFSLHCCLGDMMGVRVVMEVVVGVVVLSNHLASAKESCHLKVLL